ncbi:MAG: hypothetical protein KF861_03750 [Planctomycetaceae bacterium]|nr:hypothetical protein [Planctomycetaceae bacterium]
MDRRFSSAWARTLRRVFAAGALLCGALGGMIVGPSHDAAAQLSLPSLPRLSLGPFSSTPSADPAVSVQPIGIVADHAQQWSDQGTTVLLLRGRCQVTQGDEVYAAERMVLWLVQKEFKDQVEDRMVMYLEGQVRASRIDGQRVPPSLVAELKTLGGTTFHGGEPFHGKPATHDQLYIRAAEQTRHLRPSVVQTVQHTVPELPAPGGFGGGAAPGLVSPSAPYGVHRRHVTIVPRNFEIGFVMQSHETENTVPPELIVTITRGVNIVVEGVPVSVGGVTQLGTIDLSADRAVIWTDPRRLNDLSFGADLDPDTPFQIYLEGNIVVRQGDHVLRASHGFYDVRHDQGAFDNVELRSFLSDWEGDVRLRAGRVRQLGRDSFHAQDAWVTGSQFGKPGYRLQAADIFLERRPGNPYPWTVNPNDPDDFSSLWITSYDNRFLIGDVPILYTPVVSAPAEDPQIPLRNVRVEYDRIFGAQLRTTWNIESLFGLNLPPKTDWDLQLDYLSDRGPGVGSAAEYRGATEIFGIPTLYSGMGDAYYIYDDGTDNLGLDRRNLPLADQNRGRFLWRNRFLFPNNIWARSEVGYISDRNFLEQYFENEWDDGKDNETLLEIGQQVDNVTITGLARERLNDFSNDTEWLRGDLTVLSEPLFNDWLTWSSHSSIGYGRIEPAQPPFDPTIDVFQPLPYYADADGMVAMTRHELVLPLDFGPLNVDPYLLGEAAHWGESLNGDDLSRLYGSVGVRASIQFTKLMPHVQNRILGLNGLAHKMIFDADYSLSDSSQDLGAVPQYNEFDDNAQERFRSRYLVNEFGGAFAPTFEPRMYAVRSGAGRAVTSPYYELVDDQQVLRLGWRHRLQTKVGPLDRPRIKDWMTLDFDASYFPDEDRDNFGEEIGLFSTRYAWNVGERTTLLANSLFDFFDVNQQIWNVGVLSQRSARGSIYAGFRQVRGGPIDSQIITASYSYLMSPKWVSSLGTAYDVAEGEDRGQSLTISRIGGDFIFHLGAKYDRSKNNAGIGISIEPRFGHFRTSDTQLGSLLGVR